MKTNIERIKSVGNTILNLITSIQENEHFMKDGVLVKPNTELEEDKRVLLLGLDDAFECFTTIVDGECDTKNKNLSNLANALQKCCNEIYSVNNDQKDFEELQNIKDDFENAILEY